MAPSEPAAGNGANNMTSSDLMGTLMANATYMNSPQSSDQHSRCMTQCRAQEAALVACVESIRDAGRDESKSAGNACLGPAVMAWTECCATANNSDN